MSGTDATGYQLDDEQRARLRDCLGKAGITPPSREFDRFVRDVEDSISVYLTTKLSATLRENHDALRAVWRPAHEDDPPVGMLRARVNKLPKTALEYINRRALRVIPRLFPGETFENSAFLDWAEKAPGDKLVKALRVLAADGAQIVVGRSRGSGKRSSRRVEPMILGEVRGVGAKKREGGRPNRDAQRELVTNLALDWTSATGNAPERGRSDRTGFGDLVHSVFQWLLPAEQTAGRANYALRQHWSEVEKANSIPSLRNFLSRYRSCLDCKWALNPQESPDEFLCGLLKVSCASARACGQECGPEGNLFELG
jgi:hypothetical protein